MALECLGGHLLAQKRSAAEIDARANALRAMTSSSVPFLVAGAYALFEYTGVFRDTKDLDLFLRRRDLEEAFRALEAAGFRTELIDAGWIGKGYAGEYFVDLIFSSGNGVALVDDLWFEHARPAPVMGVPCLLAPPEEMIWSKAFILERERFDGADVNHIVHACGEDLDWERLLARFDSHWEVLLAHLSLYRFAYPGERSKVPRWVLERLCRRTLEARDWAGRVCRGDLLSRAQYWQDHEHRGFASGRALAERERARTATNGGSEVPPGGGG
jgi:hypothetical protein